MSLVAVETSWQVAAETSCRASPLVSRPLKLLLVTLLSGGAIWLAWHLAGTSAEVPLVEPSIKTEAVASGLLQASPEPADKSQSSTPDAPGTSPALAQEKPSQEPIGVRLNRWLLSSGDLNVVAENIANAFPTVAPEDHATVVHELIPLVPDEHYPRLGRILLDPKTHPKALDMLFRNLSYRPDNIELPMEVELMQMGPKHPLSEDARLKLTVRFGEDYGNNWNLWRTRIAEELKDR